MTEGLAPEATPLPEDEREELIPGHITNREQLNEWEHANIVRAESWAFSRRRSDIVSLAFLRRLHGRMFDSTWTWAGQFRNTERNLGAPPYRIREDLYNVCADTRTWLDEDVFPLPELAARFHHRIVFVHPFPDGNGRHARLAADVLLFTHDCSRLNWGGRNLGKPGERRRSYIEALRSADRRDYQPLLAHLGID